MKTLRQMSGDQIIFLIVITGLLFLGVFLVLNDPNLNKTSGRSRVDWPPATTTKP